jgi:hypothetical protein
MRFLRLLKPLLVLGVLISMCSEVRSQTSNGTIVGTVSDKTGAVIPNATVKVSSPQFGGEPRSATTDSLGSYRVGSLLPGRYVVIINAAGFSEHSVANVEVKASLEVTVNALLELSGVSSSITVEAGAEQELKTQSGDISGNISQQETANLPIASLNPIDLVKTFAGVQDDHGFAFTNGSGFSVNGTRPRANNFLIDGQDDNDNTIGGQAFQPSNLAAIQEVAVLTNSYSAEFGRGGGSVTNVVTKSGGNDVHGQAWEINTNSAFAAVPAELGAVGFKKNPVDNDNTFGFAVGGPAKRDKLFYFGTLQWDTTRGQIPGASPSTLTIPTAAGIATLQSLPANPNIQFLLDSLGGLVAPSNSSVFDVPLGNGRPAVEENQFVRNAHQQAKAYEWHVRLDLLATASDTISARYRRNYSSLTPDFFANSGSLPAFDTQQGGPSQAFTGTWVHTFSPRYVNEVRFSYTNIDFQFGETPSTIANPLSSHANVGFSGASGLPQLGITVGFPQFRGHKNWQYQEALSMALGRHQFKVGADVSHLIVRESIPFDSRGTITYKNGGGFTDLANFIDDFSGSSGSVNINFGSPIVTPFVTTYFPYAQDVWRVAPNRTLDLGLRYEYWGTVGNALPFPALDPKQTFGLPGAKYPDILAFQQIPQKKNFAPRIGFAYTPHFWSRFLGREKTVFRGGYGIFYDGLFTNILDNTASGPPNTGGGSIVASVSPAQPRGPANFSALLSSIQPSAPNPLLGFSTMSANLRNPLTQQWNLNLQHELRGGIVVTAAYVGTRGSHLFVNSDLNPFDPNTGQRVNPLFGATRVRTNGGDSIYHAGQLTLERKFSHGLFFRGAYTYSKFIDDSSEVFATTGGASYPQDLRNQGGDSGPSAFDRRHRLALTYIWDLPYVHNSDSAALKISSWITRGWQWSGSTIFQSGGPNTIFDGFDANGDGHSTNDRPSLGNASKPFTSRGVDGAQLGPPFVVGSFYDLPCIFNDADPVNDCPALTANDFHWVVPASGVGNVGRNTFFGPNQQYWDMSIQRTIKIPMGRLEHQAISFRAEFFNAFNHPNLRSIDPSDPNDSVANLASPLFGAFGTTIIGGRQIKFWAKYEF